jgi:hypothetical protein
LQSSEAVPAAPAGSRVFDLIRLHPSLLPRHRGADPYVWAILSCDTVTGVTAHAARRPRASRTMPSQPAQGPPAITRGLHHSGIGVFRSKT